MNPELDQRDTWDEQSCREFEQMLDEREADEESYAKWFAERERRLLNQLDLEREKGKRF